MINSIGEDIDLNILNKHAALLVILFDLLNKQAQPKRIIEATPTSLTMDLKVNLQKTAVERLIVQPLNSALKGWDVRADYDNKVLVLQETPRVKGKQSKAVNKPVGDAAA
jgi:hypothetical protein